VVIGKYAHGFSRQLLIYILAPVYKYPGDTSHCIGQNGKPVSNSNIKIRP